MQTYSLKFVLVGDSSVGKSQLLRRFTKKEFSNDMTSTLNMEFSTRDIPFERCNIKAQIWDTAGQERFESMTKAYYRDAMGALLVYDVTNYQSFANIKKIWLKQLSEFGHQKIHIVLAGNKMELAENGEDGAKREVGIEEAEALAKEYNIDFVETSALTGANVDCVFRRVILSVAPVIPDVNTHLDLTNLPHGWMKVPNAPSKRANSSESSGLIDNKVNEKEDYSGDTVADSYCNYWTGELTDVLPTKPARSGMIHEVKNVITQSYIPTASFCARTNPPKGGEGGAQLSDFGSKANGGDDEAGLRLSTTSTGGIQLDMIKGKCFCVIL